MPTNRDDGWRKVLRALEDRKWDLRTVEGIARERPTCQQKTSRSCFASTSLSFGWLSRETDARPLH